MALVANLAGFTFGDVLEFHCSAGSTHTQENRRGQLTGIVEDADKEVSIALMQFKCEKSRKGGHGKVAKAQMRQDGHERVVMSAVEGKLPTSLPGRHHGREASHDGSRQRA